MAAQPGHGLLARFGVRARLVLITLIAATPMLVLLAMHVAADRAAAIAAARDGLNRIALIGASRQAELVLGSRQALHDLAGAPEVAARMCEDIAPTQDQGAFAELGVVPAGPVAACDSPTLQATDVPLIRAALAEAAPEPAIAALPPAPGRAQPVLVAAQAVGAAGPGRGFVYIVLNADQLAAGAPPLPRRLTATVVLVEPQSGTVLAGVLPGTGSAAPPPASLAPTSLTADALTAAALAPAALAPPALTPPALTAAALPPAALTRASLAPAASAVLAPALRRAAAAGGATVADGLVASFAPVVGTGQRGMQMALRGPGQAVMAAVPVDTVLAADQQHLPREMAAALAASAAGCLLAWTLAHVTQVRPLRILLDTAEALGDGALDARARLPPWEAPEFRRLAQRLADMAARVQATQLRLTESERLHRFLSDNATDMIAFIARDGGVSYVSSACRELLGHAPEAVLGSRLFDLADAEDRAGREAALRALWRGDQDEATLRQSLRHRDGHLVPLELKLRLVRDPATGAPTDVVASARDITAELRAEQALLASEGELRLLAKAASDVVVRIRPDGTIAYVSPSYHDMFGLTPAEVIGRSAAHRFHPDDLAARNAVMRRLLSGEAESAAVEYRVGHKDGHFVPVDARYRLVRDPHTGAPAELVLSLRDITERRRAEQALRESEARLRLLAENATDMIVHLDLDFRRIYVSPACQELFGYTQDEMMRQADYGSGMHPEDVPLVQAAVARLRAGERSASFSYRRQHRAGHYIWVRTSARRVASDDGYIMVIHDVTELKQAEARLREQRQFFRALFEHTPDALMVLCRDEDGGWRIEQINQAMAAVAAETPEALQGRKLMEVLPPPWNDQAVERAQRCVALGGPVRGAIDTAMTGGRHIEMIHIPLSRAAGDTERVLVTGRDISHLRAAELALAQANSRMAMAEQIAGLGHIRILLGDHTVEWSEQAYLMFGLDPAGPPPDWEQTQALCHPEDTAEMLAVLASLQERGAPQTVTLRARRADGEYRHFQARLVLERDHSGAPAAIFAVIVDVTEDFVTQQALREARDAAEQAQRVLAELALEDALTGLANRRQLDLTLAEQLRRAARDAAPLALALLDVDHFKQYNDRYGHQAGDDCLRAVAVAARSCLKRQTDVAARYGGEEFAVLLPATDLAGAWALAEDIRSCIRSLQIPHAGSPHGVVTISAGVAVLVPPHPEGAAAALIRMADAALYEAKSQGRDNVRTHRPSPALLSAADS